MSTTNKTVNQGTPVPFAIQLARLTAEIVFCLTRDKKSSKINIESNDVVRINVSSIISGELTADIAECIKLYGGVTVKVAGGAEGLGITLARPPQPLFPQD